MCHRKYIFFYDVYYLCIQIYMYRSSIYIDLLIDLIYVQKIYIIPYLKIKKVYRKSRIFGFLIVLERVHARYSCTYACSQLYVYMHVYIFPYAYVCAYVSGSSLSLSRLNEMGGKFLRSSRPTLRRPHSHTKTSEMLVSYNVKGRGYGSFFPKSRFLSFSEGLCSHTIG